MPVPSKRLKQDIEDELDYHASLHWPRLGGVEVRWRGGHGYVVGYLEDEQDDSGHTGELDDEHEPEEQPIPLCRLAYLGADDDWGFALYDPATDSYQDTLLPDGAFSGTPQDALDCACRIHVSDTTSTPPQPL